MGAMTSFFEEKKEMTESWTLLQNQVEQGVTLKLLDGTIKEGFVYAVDPQTLCALLLVKKKGCQDDVWSATAVFADGVATCECWDNPDNQTFADAVSLCPIIQKVAKFGKDNVHFDAEEISRRRELVVAALKQHGLAPALLAPTLLSENTSNEDGCGGGAAVVSVLGGLARILPPYGPDDCRTANPQVHRRIAELLSSALAPAPAPAAPPV